ncbi:MAG: dinitrogenase iron-molybdenum cofactor biosynthesis protein [Chloroflexi bacterium]|nr:dinitrogenase iron-molybdenum cofactor biosynthesis protein [Chloroflexota bacterium]
MKVVVTASGANLDAPASPVFGRCSHYVFVDSETMAFQALENPAVSAGGGAGIQAAQFVVERGAQAVITGNAGPNAFQVLQAAGVEVYLTPGGTVRQAVEAFGKGNLQAIGQANVAAHAGMGAGMGRGMGMGRRSMAGGVAGPGPAREAELSELRQSAADLRQQLAVLLERIDRLEKEG